MARKKSDPTPPSPDPATTPRVGVQSRIHEGDFTADQLAAAPPADGWQSLLVSAQIALSPTPLQILAVDLLAAAVVNVGLSVSTRLDAAEALMHEEAAPFTKAIEAAVAFLTACADKSSAGAVNAEPRERVRAMAVLLRNPVR